MLSDSAHKIFNVPCIALLDIEDATFRIFENRILYVVVKKNKKATMEMIESGYKFLDDNGGGKFYNIYQFESFSDIDPEVRDWAAKDSGNNYTIADAIVISGIAQKIIADFYLKFNKPEKPTKIFTSIESAVIWINDLISSSTN